jgi:DNA invertase Pin-like site-specific DNA recombinase
MSPHFGKFVAYFRVSTDRQGKSGLGLEAQREAVMSYLNGGRWTLAAEFTEVESGKRSDNRPELEKAIAACKRLKAKLVIAKLDRLSRNLAFIAALMESGVEFVAVDNPHMNKLTIHILAAVAEHEREMISERTKAALAAAKRRGQRLGNPTTLPRLQNAARPLGRPMRGGLPPMCGRSLMRSCGPGQRATMPLRPSSTSAMSARPAAGNGRMCRWGQFCTLSSQAPSHETRQALGALNRSAIGTQRLPIHGAGDVRYLR